MSFTSILVASLAVVFFAVATIATFIAVRRAPLGIETDDGFEFVSEQEAARERRVSSHQRHQDRLVSWRERRIAHHGEHALRG
jgi:hypothetical protein